MDKFHVGTSGWSYRHWAAGVFYPPEVKSGKYLEYYITQFDCTELNFSFYRLPQARTIQGWAERTPEFFRFCPKMSRFVTHQKKLANIEEPLKLFFERFSILKTRLGPFLIQLPANLRYDATRAEGFFILLASYYGGYHFALEARDASWLSDESLGLLRKYRIALVIAHSDGRFPYREAITTDWTYLRFHGPTDLYASDYPTATLRDYAGKIKTWMAQGIEVWAFFNNDAQGYAVKNAKQLRGFVRG
jgi:uncharacterized protein YecE (DUF72 family)